MRRRGTTARPGRRPSRTFVSLTGPAGNIGDALIRRATLEWATGTSDELVAYVGHAPDAWLAQLGLPSDAIVLRSKRSVPRWLWMILTAPARPVLVFEAGEVPLDRGNGLRELVMVDVSHANSSKQHAKQIEVAADVAAQVAAGDGRIMGVMIESHLEEGRQDIVAGQQLKPGVSVTDACISFAQTVPVLDGLAEAVRARRSKRG